MGGGGGLFLSFGVLGGLRSLRGLSFQDTPKLLQHNLLNSSIYKLVCGNFALVHIFLISRNRNSCSLIINNNQNCSIISFQDFCTLIHLQLLVKLVRMTWCPLHIRSKSWRRKNLLTTSAPNVKETPLSFSPQPFVSLSGSDHSRSQRGPERIWNTSYNLQLTGVANMF